MNIIIILFAQIQANQKLTVQQATLSFPIHMETVTTRVESDNTITPVES